MTISLMLTSDWLKVSLVILEKVCILGRLFTYSHCSLTDWENKSPGKLFNLLPLNHLACKSQRDADFILQTRNRGKASWSLWESENVSRENVNSPMCSEMILYGIVVKRDNVWSRGHSVGRCHQRKRCFRRWLNNHTPEKCKYKDSECFNCHLRGHSLSVAMQNHHQKRWLENNMYFTRNRIQKLDCRRTWEMNFSGPFSL